jgi:hypothetical protein
VVAVAALPVQEPLEPEQLPVTLPVNVPAKPKAVSVPVSVKLAEEMDAAEPLVLFESVPAPVRSLAVIAAMLSLLPLPRRKYPLVVAPARLFIAAC